MADDPAPAQATIITPEVFRDKAETAGKKLDSRLKEHLHTGSKNPQFVSFKREPYEDVLEDVMTAFKTEQIAGVRHPGRTLEWLKIYQMVQALPYHERTTDNDNHIDDTEENIFFLALLLGEEQADKVGWSFRLASSTRFNIEEGAIYLAYKVV